MNQINFDEVPIVLQPDNGTSSTVAQLQNFIEDRYNIKFEDYWSFLKWSTDYLAEFWGALWDFYGVISAKKYDEVIDSSLPIYEASTSWFKGALVNYGENLLKYRDDRVAFITTGEESDVKRITYAQMYEEVELYAAAFRKSGLKKGDVIASYMPNRIEPVFAMIAATSIGAIFTGALPLFGPEAVLSRIKQVNPKFLITIDRFKYEGKEIEMLPKVKQIVEGLSLDKVMVVSSRGKANRPDISSISNSCFLDSFLEVGRGSDGSVPPITFEHVSPSHPVFVCFTSGTSGEPKPLLFGFGALLSIANNMGIAFNSDRESVWLSMSPVGWATWNLFASVPFLGGSVVLFESSPYFLSRTFFWDLIDHLRISHVIVSASVTDEFEKRAILPTEKHSLKSLKILLAGGSVVKPESYDFFSQKVKKDLWYCSCYGTTETMGALAMLTVTIPIYRGEISAKSLGYDAQVVDDEGNPVVGELGHVVMSKPMPGLLLGILGDEDGSVTKEKYFSKFPGKFEIGDLAIINPKTNGWYVCGRSDATLKQRGCRFGSSEIYSVVEKFPEVRDSLCVSKYDAQLNESAVLFVQPCPPHPLDEALVARIRGAIAAALTPRHVPDIILEAQEIPYTVNGKKTEALVKNIINHKPYNASNVRNPDSLKNFIDRPEFRH